MDSILTFLIKLQADQGNVVNVATQTSRQLDDISRHADSAGARIRRAFSFSNFKSSLMSIPGMEFLTNPYVLIGAGLGAITKLGSQAQQTSVVFTVLTGSETKARNMLAEIYQFADRSLFGRMDLSDNARTMLNFGIATNRVVPLLKQLGDISGGNKGRMESLALVLGQVSANSRLMGQDLLQFVNAGWNPLRDMSEMSGKSMGQLRDMMSKGQISFEDVTKAMQHATSAGGIFYGMMQKQSQTVAGKFSTMKDSIVEQAINMFQQINGPLNYLLDIGLKAIPKIFGMLNSLFGIMASGVKFILEYKTEFAVLAGIIATVWGITKAYSVALAVCHGIMTVVTVATKAWAAAQAVLNFVMSLNPIVFVVAGIAALVIAIGVCWNKFAGFRAVVLTVWDTMKGFGNIIKTYVIDRIRTLLSGIGKVGTALAKLFSGDFKGAWNSAVAGFQDISGLSSARRAAGATRQLVSGVSDTYRANYRRESAQRATRRNTPRQSVIQSPALKGSNNGNLFASGGGGGNGTATGGGRGRRGNASGGRNTAEAMATGGSRNTSINVSIGKFFDNIYVTMADKTDTADLQRIVVQSLNRALAIATSTDR